MKLFGPRQVIDPGARELVDRLAAEVTQLRSELKLLQTEQDTVHTEVRKWMRRAENAERRVRAIAGENQELATDNGAPVAVTPPRRKLWGARARIAARRSALPAAMNGTGDDAEEESENGPDS